MVSIGGARTQFLEPRGCVLIEDGLCMLSFIFALLDTARRAVPWQQLLLQIAFSSPGPA